MLSRGSSFVQPMTVPSPSVPQLTVAPPPVLPSPLAPPPPLWRRKFPTIISSIFAFAQAVVTFVIVGCEIGSMLVDIVTATIYVGIWASLFFTSAWISQAIAACCCRNRKFASFTLALQVLSMFFAVCVVGFDIFYLVAPSTCFFPSYLCNSAAPTRGVFYTQDNFNNVKMSLIKGQLAAGIVMFLLCFVYVIIYIVTTIRVHRAKQPRGVNPVIQMPWSTPAMVSNGMWTAPPPPPPPTNYPVQIPNHPYPMAMHPPPSITHPLPIQIPIPPYPAPMMHPYHDARMAELTCPSCKSVMNMTATKR